MEHNQIYPRGKYPRIRSLKKHTHAWLFCGCTVIDKTYSFVYICNNMLRVYFQLSTCLLKVWVLAQNYYVMLMNKEIPLNSTFAVRPNQKPLVWKWRQTGLLLLISPPSMHQYQQTRGIYLQADFRELI